jgi:hypothetical protein
MQATSEQRFSKENFILNPILQNGLKIKPFAALPLQSPNF